MTESAVGVSMLPAIAPVDSIATMDAEINVCFMVFSKLKLFDIDYNKRPADDIIKQSVPFNAY
jgi:hypothetical protein